MNYCNNGYQRNMIPLLALGKHGDFSLFFMISFSFRIRLWAMYYKTDKIVK
jgi:hypothetical protein